MSEEEEENSIFKIDPVLKRQLWGEMVEAFVDQQRKELQEEGIEQIKIEKELKKLKKRFLKRKD